MASVHNFTDQFCQYEFEKKHYYFRNNEKDFDMAIVEQKKKEREF
jgi:hypothetical protein